MKTIYISILAFMWISLKAQKVEKEYRIDREYVPSQAVSFIETAYSEPVKVKWYYEETSGKKSYEAKLKYKNNYHSIEFDTLGKIEDIEIEVAWKELEPEIQAMVSQYFSTEYQKYKVQKIQKQISGDTEIIKKYIMEQHSCHEQTRYEIEYMGKTDSEYLLWEGLFNKDGRFLEKREVELIPTQNLNY